MRSVSLEHRNHCTFRICPDSETADAWNVVRRPVHLSTLFPDFSGSAINIVDGHITNPSRPSACVPNLFVQGHEARHCGSGCHQQRIINAFHTGALSGPADAFAVKLHSRGGRSERPRVGKEWVSTLRSRWSPYN